MPKEPKELTRHEKEEKNQKSDQQHKDTDHKGQLMTTQTNNNQQFL